VRQQRVPNWEERLGEVLGFALGSFLTPISGCFSYEFERKGVAGKGYWKLLKTKGEEMRPTAKNRTARRSGEGKFETSQPRIA
jgi:hypothetical protein